MSAPDHRRDALEARVAALEQQTEVELCGHVCHRCGQCDRCCDGHEGSYEDVSE